MKLSGSLFGLSNYIMIRATDIQENLLGLIGWEQNYDSDLRIAEDLTRSESGIYYQQVHPLLTLQNISCIAPDFRNTVSDSYSGGRTYTKGSIVEDNGKLYRALQESIGVGVENTEYWAETNLFSEWLRRKTKASIQKAITRFFNEKAAQGELKTLCENKTLFDGTGRLADTVRNKGNIVGFEIVPLRAKGVTIKINRIGLQFTEPGEYILYLMHSSSEEPIRVLRLNKVLKNSVEWIPFNDLFLPYRGTETDTGGSWYLCYLQSELPEGSQAIRKDRDWSKGPCRSCSLGDYISWQAWSKYLEVHPFSVNEEVVKPISFSNDFGSDFSIKLENENTITLWDIEDNQYTYDNNYGLNLEVTVACDITDFIIEQKILFQDVIAKQVAADFIKEFAYNANVRTNRHALNASRLDLMYELDGDSSSMKKSGLNYQLDLAYKALKVNTQGVDRVCLPCKNNGIKYRTV
jgi:hypothetical protein